jgi:Ca-activated chloride channel family protein
MTARRPVTELSAGMTLVVLLVPLIALAAALAGILLLVDAQFAAPAWLHAGWAAPLIVLLEAHARWRRARVRAAFGEGGAVARLVTDRAQGPRALRALLAASALLFLAVACARPHWGVGEEELRRRGVDVFVLVDTSTSMLAEDVKPYRLARAKLALASLVDRLEGDRIGLVAFAGEARLVCPLTADHGAVKAFLDLLGPDVLQVQGTAIGPALALVARSVPEDSTRGVAVVLITDGEDMAGGIDAPLAELKRRGIVVHALGIGRPEGAPVPVVEDGRPGYMQDDQGRPVVSHLDLAALEHIARETGGVSGVASSGEMELTAIGSAIASMDQTDATSTATRVRPERQEAFLAAAFVLLCLQLALPDGGRLLSRKGATRVERLAAAQVRGRNASNRRVA